MRYFKFNLKKLRIGHRGRSLTIEGIGFELRQEARSMAIMGESGMGKTTIFKSLFPKYISLWELESPFEFECEHMLGEESINHETIKKGKTFKNTGFATQIPYFFNSKTVKENIFAPLKWKKIKWSQEEERNYISMFRLDQLAKREMSILSGGQRQIVNIARMMVLRPQLAIIDECFSNMNEEMAKRYIAGIKESFPDCFFLLTSHRRADVECFGSRIISLTKSQYRSGQAYVTLE